MIERMITDIAKFIKSQGELHNICKTMLKIPYTGKSRLVLEAVACVLDALLPGVCLHASCHTLFLDPLFLFLSCIYLFLELRYYFHYYLLLIVFLGLNFLAFHTVTLAP